MDFTEVRSFNNYFEAHIEFGKLQAAGINCWLKDENTVTLVPVWGNAVGGIKLMVANNQLDTAVAELKSIFAERKLNFSCPECGSHNLEYINTPRKAINWFSSIFTWLLGSYAIAVEQAWHCFDCNAEFTEPVEENVFRENEIEEKLN